MELIPKLHVTVFFIRRSQSDEEERNHDGEQIWAETFESMRNARRFISMNSSSWDFYFVTGGI